MLEKGYLSYVPVVIITTYQMNKKNPGKYNLRKNLFFGFSQQ